MIWNVMESTSFQFHRGNVFLTICTRINTQMQQSFPFDILGQNEVKEVKIIQVLFKYLSGAQILNTGNFLRACNFVVRYKKKLLIN